MRSKNSLFVIFKFHNKWLDVLALSTPFADALLSIRVEVLLLLILQGLVGKSSVLLPDEILLCFNVLLFSLLFEVVCQLDPS